MEILMMKKLLEANDTVAAENRAWFAGRGLYVVNLMGAPGSGKTTLIDAVAKKMDVPAGVVEGDIASAIDAEHLEAEGIPSVQINTGGECHLDARVIREGAEKLGMRDAVVFIENVGNLICPAEFDLGENLRLLAASVPEGDDKPYKYVPMFSYADTVALTKRDLTEAVGFRFDYFARGLRALSRAEIYPVSCKTGEGVEGLAEFLANAYHKTYPDK